MGVAAVLDTPLEDITKTGETWYLIDGSGYIFRAFHGLPPMTRPDGTPINAVYGFCNMLLKLQQDYHAEGRMLVVFDAGRITFRNDIYDQYKAHRPPAPEELVPQFPIIREAVEAFGVPQIEQQGFEADDLIATYAKHIGEAGGKAVVVSSDKDLMQLLNDSTSLLDPMKNLPMGLPEVEKKFGVTPDKVIDVQALAGDSADNVPGVPGIGVKTAAQLIGEFGTLENLLENAHTIKQNKRRENLIEFAEQARISKQLVTLKDDVALDLPLADIKPTDHDKQRLLTFLADQGFRSILKRVDGWNPAKVPLASNDAGNNAGAAQPSGKIERQYELVTTETQLARWCDNLIDAGSYVLDVETTGLEALEVDLVGISLSHTPGKACYIPIGHKPAGGELLEEVPEQLSLEQVKKHLQPVLALDHLRLIGQNLKYDLLVLRQAGFEISNCLHDTMLLSYAINGSEHGHGMDELSERYLGEKPVSFKEVVGKKKAGQDAPTFATVPLDKALEYAAEDADLTLRLYQHFQQELIPAKSATVYETLERPLLPILTEMEWQGIKVDPQRLRRLSAEFAEDLARLEKEIFALVGHEFNLASPKQLGPILFEEQGLPGGKKTKTGSYATGSEILEPLAADGHELPQKILDWRQLAKLRSTYSEALLGQINSNTGRVHTSFAQTVTTTGRLSSSNPNLQNIPIRTEAGKRIREAFIAEEGKQLISIDYSQIELRLLAEIADIPSLKKAFANDEDIHAATARDVFGIEGEVSSDDRRRAKTVNFGIIYGISAFGLAQRLGVPRHEGKEIIEAYFARYPGIRNYMDRTVEEAKANGFVATLFGRQCRTPGINDKNGARRSFAERAAINAPIQGTAADIIRRAMMRMPAALAEAGLQANMLLTVHDELIFEAAPDEVEAVIKTASAVMEKAALPAVALTVPLKVEAGVAESWAGAH